MDTLAPIFLKESNDLSFFLLTCLSEGPKHHPRGECEANTLFSSSYIEYVYEAIGLDLTPGASSRNSAPEHIWNAALWWHDAFKSQNRPIFGMCVLRDRGCSMLGTEE